MNSFKTKWRLCAVAVIAALQAGSVQGESLSRNSSLAEGTRWEMPVWEISGLQPGPTVVIVGGIHGNEPAGMKAAEQIAQWPVHRGRLIVIPSANHFALQAGTRRLPDTPADLADLNRNFPLADGKCAARDDLARVLWEYLQRVQPDWLIDLHEGFDFHQLNAKSVGSSIIYHPSQQSETVVPAMLAAVNASIENSQKEFVPLRPPVDGSLARAAAEHLGAEAMILETTRKQPLELRIQQHCAMVKCLLDSLAMLEEPVAAR